MNIYVNIYVNMYIYICKYVVLESCELPETTQSSTLLHQSKTLFLSPLSP